MEQIDCNLTTKKKFKNNSCEFHNERVATDIWVHGLDSPPVYIVYDVDVGLPNGNRCGLGF